MAGRAALGAGVVLVVAGIVGCGDAPPPPCRGALVAAGGDATWIMTADGTAWAWGDLFTNAGDGTTSRVPLKKWRAPNAHELNTRSSICLLTTEHTLQCSELAQGAVAQWTNVQSFAMGFVSRSDGTGTVLAVKDDGTVRTSTGLVSSPLDPAGGAELLALGGDVVAVAVGGSTSFDYVAIKTDGSLWAGSLVGSSPPPPVQLTLPAAAITASIQEAASQTYVALDDGSLYRANAFESYMQPELLDLRDVTTLTSGHAHTCGLTAQGSVWCWGANYFGQLGFLPIDDGFRGPGQVVELGHDVTAISAGANHTCARRSDASIWCWGGNQAGQTTGSLATSERPTQVLGCQ